MDQGLGIGHSDTMAPGKWVFDEMSDLNLAYPLPGAPVPRCLILLIPYP